MVGLTYTPPLLPVIRAAALAGETIPFVVQIGGANVPGSVQNSLAESLQAAAGPGNVVTGTVKSASPDGNVTLTTANGTDVTLHRPPELGLLPGSSVTLRVALGGPLPQATILSVDGRPPALRQPVAAPVAPPVPQALPAGVSPGSLWSSAAGASAYAASLAATISLEDETALQNLLWSNGELLPSGVDTAAVESDDAAAPLLATLIRPAPAALGQVPLPVGTRYQALLGTVASSLTADLEVEPGFLPQSTVLAGRAVGGAGLGEALVETSLGLLSLGVPADGDVALVPGTAVRLAILAVAPPLVSPPSLPSAELPQGSLIEQILQSLGAAAASPVATAMQALMLPSGPMFLPAAWAFIAGIRKRGIREAAATIRNALIERGRSDLAARLDPALDEIAGSAPQRTIDGWTVLTLPYPGLAAELPLRVYTRGPEKDQPEDEARLDPGERVVVVVSLKRLGLMQFDGLSRSGRFDLVLRTQDPLDPDLCSVVTKAFLDALGSCGAAGDIGFGRPVILQPPLALDQASSRTISA